MNMDQPESKAIDGTDHTYGPIVDPSSLLARILDAADDAIVSVDPEKRICVFNQGAERIFGYHSSELLGKNFEVLMPERLRAKHAGHFSDFRGAPVMARMMGDRGEIIGCRKDGSEFPAEASISKVEWGGTELLTVILRDVTVRNRNEQTIRSALKEKEVLLQEVHHRVKNNLQVVSSLLSMQERKVDDESVRKVFRESRNRIHSMALIHEHLYGSESLSRVEFDRYVRDFADVLYRSYRADRTRVRLKTELESLELGLDTAVPCALILNELISNALKHAFPDGRRGEIEVALSQRPDRSITLCVSDDGVGVPDDVGFWNTKSLGWKLVRTLVRQLDGEVEIGGPPGTRICVRFAPPEPIAEETR